jgi:hypothetical protein
MVFSWFFVSILDFDFGYIFFFMVCDEVTFCIFQKTKMLKSKLEALSKRLFPFLASILSACIITISLIHEATNPYGKTLSVLRAPFIGSDCLLDQKRLLEARNVGYGLWL